MENKKSLIVEDGNNIYTSGVYGIYVKHGEFRQYIYIGSSKEVADAKNRHTSMLRYGKYNRGKKQLLQKYWDCDFDLYFVVIKEVSDLNERLKEEQYYIEFYKHHAICNGDDIAKCRKSISSIEETKRRSEANQGERNPMCRLEESDVKAIRYYYSKVPKVTMNYLATIFGVSQTHIFNIIHRKRWSIKG